MECSIYIWLIPSGLHMSFKANFFFYGFFCPGDLSTDVSRVLNFPTIIVMLSIAPFRSVNIYYMYLGAPMFGT